MKAVRKCSFAIDFCRCFSCLEEVKIPNLLIRSNLLSVKPQPELPGRLGVRLRLPLLWLPANSRGPQRAEAAIGGGLAKLAASPEPSLWEGRVGRGGVKVAVPLASSVPLTSSHCTWRPWLYWCPFCAAAPTGAASCFGRRCRK